MARAVPEFSWLSRFSRPILVRGNDVRVLYSPDEFYGALLDGVQRARRRVVLSSLYLGTGEKAKGLVEALDHALSDSTRPGLQCSILLDCLRGTRGPHNSVTMLQGLLSRFHPQRLRLHLYHTPNLRGLLKRVFPERFNEGMGLQHTKIYLFDDNLMLSGANLSEDYFTDRQDRYLTFSQSPKLADYFSTLAQTIAAHSYTVHSDGSLVPVLSFDHLSSASAAQKYRKLFSNAIQQAFIPGSDARHLQDEHSLAKSQDKDSGFDTVVYPLLQMGYYGIQQEEVATRKLLEGLGREERIYLASGYFNLPPQYTSALLQAEGNSSVLAASPQAFGFFGARGIAGHVPVMYTHFAKQFLRDIVRHGCEGRVKYSEYFREGWTFHGKGLWYYLAGEQLPSLTLVGSSNYGHRSLTRDLEAQVAVITTNQRLREALHEEQERMFAYSHPLSLTDLERVPDRKLKLWQWIVTTLLKRHV